MDWSAAVGIRAVVLDIDGVLTNGTVGYGADEVVKFFNIKDEHAIKLALRQGLLVGFLSGRDDAANRRFAADLKLSFCYLGEKDKRSAFQRMLREHGLQAAECLYLGDDVVDIPLLRRAGLGVAVADAVDEVKAYADWVCPLAGGQGAVRATIVQLMQAKGLWDSAMTRYVSSEDDE